jgi:hypothetical protein
MCWEAGKAEEKPDATFSFVDADFINVASGKTNPQMAFIRYFDYLAFFFGFCAMSFFTKALYSSSAKALELCRQFGKGLYDGHTFLKYLSRVSFSSYNLSYIVLISAPSHRLISLYCLFKLSIDSCCFQDICTL